MAATKTLRREFLQLADTYKPGKFKIAGSYISEKLDGTRCFWDGGITRGLKTESVPWASVTDPKTGNRKAKIKPRATGLWSRYGNPIMAPDSFLNALPACPLDGELWAGRGKFQLCRSICAGDTPDPRFDQISYAVYSSPSFPAIFQNGEIKNANMLLDVNCKAIEKFVTSRLKDFDGDFESVEEGATFDEELLFLREAIETQSERCFLHAQTRLPPDEALAIDYAEKYLSKLLDQGAEGAVIRDGSAIWTPKRHKGLLKYKPFEDAEAVITGYVAGKEGRIGQAIGKIGALRVKTIGLGTVQFEIGSGLTLLDREFKNETDVAWAAGHPGETMPDSALGKYMKLGSTITFKYRELSDDGIPKEARYWRKREGDE